VQGRCIEPETRALLAAILWCHGPQRIMSRDFAEHVGAASSEAFALYVIVAGCGRAPKTFSKRAHKRACSRLVRIMCEPACRSNSA
jgi:hypothetical protein